MKKILYIIIVMALALNSCTKQFPVNREPVEDALSIQALMHSADTMHCVLVYISGELGLRKPDEGTVEVTCTVNGEDVPVVPDEAVNAYNWFWIDADFMPGDDVRLDVRCEGMHAYSEVTVPQRVEMELADTLVQITHDNGYTGKTIFTDLRIKDVPGEDNYYRIGPLRHRIHGYYHPRYGDYPDPMYFDDWREYEKAMNLGNDPILHDDYIITNEKDILSELNPTNYHKIFSDKLFADDVAQVRVSFHESFLRHYDYGNFPYESYSEASVSVEHIDRDTYYYYKARNSAEMTGFNSYGGLVMEPVVIPCNVVGGFGYVSISMDSSVSFRLRHYILDENDNPVEVE